MSEQTLEDEVAVVEASGQLKEPEAAKAVQVYIKIRDKRAENSKAFEFEDAMLKEQQEQIENFLLSVMEKTGGITKMGTPHGTAYIETETNFSIADDQAFYEFIRDNNSLEMLQRRISTATVKEYMKDHAGGVPPGLNIFNRQRVKIRRT